ncbi:MAG: deacetylase, partial [Candidatus Gallimonas sp.]
MRILVVRMKSVVAAAALVLSLVIGCFVAYATGAAEVYRGGAARSLPIYCVDRDDNKIAISFDCAWGVDYTDEILAHL